MDWTPCTTGEMVLTQGYRKAALSTCIESSAVSDYVPDRRTCFAGMSSGTWAAIFLVPIAVVGAAAFALHKYQQRYGALGITNHARSMWTRFRGVRYVPLSEQDLDTDLDVNMSLVA